MRLHWFFHRCGGHKSIGYAVVWCGLAGGACPTATVPLLRLRRQPLVKICEMLTPLVSRISCVLITLVILTQATLVRADVWKLQPKDRFSIETTLERSTSIRIGDGESETSKQTWQLQVEYTVTRLRNAETTFSVGLVDIRKNGQALGEADRQRVELLRQIRAKIVVDAAGAVSRISGYQDFVRRLAGVDDMVGRLLAETYPESVFTSWLQQPLWLASKDLTSGPDASWECMDEFGLGQLGSLRTIVTCHVDNVEEQTVTVGIQGEPRFVAPSPLPPASRAATFSDVQIKDMVLKGHGTAVLPLSEEAGDKSAEGAKRSRPVQRPWFDELIVTREVSGSATLTTGSQSRPFEFQQSQTQTSRLMPNFDLRANRFPVQIPLLNRKR